MDAKSKIVITGGLGFIFSYVSEYLAHKYDVLVIDNCFDGSHPEIINDSFKFLEQDAGKSWDEIVEFDPDYIVHAAAITDVDASIKDPVHVILNNNYATLEVFDAARHCKNLKKFLYVSTDEVYGECSYRKKEEDIIFPRNPYSASKAFGSHLRIAYDNTYTELHDKTTEIRMCNIFGPRQDMRKILPQLLKSVKEDYVVPVQNNGEGYREYLYVKNIPPLIELILEKGDRVYNITNNEGFTVNELIKKIEELTEKAIMTRPADRPGHDLKYQMDNTRIKELGWTPLYNFEQGIKEYFL